MNRYDRYLQTCHRLRKRYARPDGSVLTMVAGQPTRYTLLEDLAAVKYLGCNPAKLTCQETIS